MTKRVLMMTASWPPVARVGVRRPLRLARRLETHGWRPIILTPEPESVFRTLPAMDPSLVAPDIETHRVKALIPSTRIARLIAQLPNKLARLGNAALSASLFPDQYREWTSAARRSARKIDGIDLVWVTGGPFGIFLAGAAVARDLDVPLVLDYRDPWTTREDQPRSIIAPLLGGLPRLESKLLKQAVGVAYVNEDMRARNLERFGSPESADWVVIPNGFDPLDLADVDPVETAEPVLLYAGACYASRSMEPILRAFARADDAGLPPCRLEIFGELDPAAKRFLDAHPLPERVSVSSRIPATELTGRMFGAAGLLLIIGDAHRTALSAKVFDYLQAARPIIGYGPTDSDAAALIQKAGVGEWASSPEALLSLLERLATHQVAFNPNAAAIRPYSADAMAEQTASLLDSSHSRFWTEQGRVQRI